MDRDRGRIRGRPRTDPDRHLADALAEARARPRGPEDGLPADIQALKETAFVPEPPPTAPMIVGSWINLQYYGSTVDNRVFGSGNKTLHNVVGALGVLEGNSGDLRPGLTFQSVHDGERFVHEPMRLNVVIEAPLDAINGIIEKHEMVRHLFDNQWLHLWALDDDGRIAHRYGGGLTWEPVTPACGQPASTRKPDAAPAG